MPALFYVTQGGRGKAGEAADGIVGQPLVVDSHFCLEPADEPAHACMYAGLFSSSSHDMKKLG